MSHESAESLPSLAHPIFVNPGDEKNETGLFLPPYPEIDLKNWDGFTFSHLPWMAFNHTDSRQELEFWEICLRALHETFHGVLASFSFSRLLRHATHILCALIATTFEERQEEIPVPLRLDLSRNALEVNWEFIVALQRESEVVEEVYAVHSSLLELLKTHMISNGERRDFATQYQKKYGKSIVGYAALYNVFDLTVNKIGTKAAEAIVLIALDTLYPRLAFFNTMIEIHKVGPTNNISDFSIRQAVDYFNELINRLDPDDSIYKRQSLYELLERAELECEREEIKHIFAEFLEDIPTAWMIGSFVKDKQFIRVHFSTREEDVQVNYGDFFLLLEAIRQQLTQGIGLLCPFWLDAPDRCCGGRNREFLEKVWSWTKPDLSCKLWKRMGCLQERCCNKLARR
jgi:hypothetical protein